jgi:CubicO group peptidase (beta-lactamase class C family)
MVKMILAQLGIISCLSIGSCPQSLLKQEPEIAAVLRLAGAKIASEAAERNVAGISAAIVYDQDLLWSGGFGYADLEKRIPADSQTIYRVGSISKVFTSVMLMQLRDKGEVALDDPIQKYLPSLKIKNRFPDSPLPTFRQIASHTAGFPREAPLQDSYLHKGYPSMEDIITTLGQSEMSFPPLTQVKYSNLSVSLMGFALSKIAGQPYTDYVVQHILQPLGMNRSGFETTPALTSQTAVGYKLDKAKQLQREPIEIAYGGYAPAGGLNSSIDDIVHFMSLQFRDDSEGGRQVLRGSSVREMRTLQWINPDWTSGWGIGFEIRRIDGHISVGHAGDLPGFDTAICMVPDLKLGVAVFINTRSDAEEIVDRVLQTVVPIFAEVEERRAKLQVKPALAAWGSYVGSYHSDIFSSDLIVRVQNEQLILAWWRDGREGAPMHLSPETTDAFRMKDGHSPGELLIFIRNAMGNITGLREGSYSFDRVTSLQ